LFPIHELENNTSFLFSGHGVLATVFSRPRRWEYLTLFNTGFVTIDPKCQPMPQKQQQWLEVAKSRKNRKGVKQQKMLEVGKTVKNSLKRKAKSKTRTARDVNNSEKCQNHF
jgi:hypothetical protein